MPQIPREISTKFFFVQSLVQIQINEASDQEYRFMFIKPEY